MQIYGIYKNGTDELICTAGIGTTEDEMAGWHHRLDGRESE